MQSGAEVSGGGGDTDREMREVVHTLLAQELTLAVVSKLHANPQRLVFP